MCLATTQKRSGTSEHLFLTIATETLKSWQLKNDPATMPFISMVLSLLHDVPGNESNKEASTVPMHYSNSHFLPKTYVSQTFFLSFRSCIFFFFFLSFFNPVTGIYISLLSSHFFLKSPSLQQETVIITRRPFWAAGIPPSFNYQQDLTLSGLQGHSDMGTWRQKVVWPQDKDIPKGTGQIMTYCNPTGSCLLFWKWVIMAKGIFFPLLLTAFENSRKGLCVQVLACSKMHRALKNCNNNSLKIGHFYSYEPVCLSI